MSETIFVQVGDSIRLAVSRTTHHVSIDVQMLDERWTKSKWISDGDTVLVPLNQASELAEALTSVAGERRST